MSVYVPKEVDAINLRLTISECDSIGHHFSVLEGDFEWFASECRVLEIVAAQILPVESVRVCDVHQGR